MSQLGKHPTSVELVNFMLQSRSIDDWNNRREMVKRHRKPLWVFNIIDHSGLVKVASFNLLASGFDGQKLEEPPKPEPEVYLRARIRDLVRERTGITVPV